MTRVPIPRGRTVALNEEQQPPGEGAPALETLPDVLTAGEVATVLRCSVGFVYQAIRRNELPALRLGRRVVIPKAVLISCLASPLTGGRGRRKGT